MNPEMAREFIDKGGEKPRRERARTGALKRTKQPRAQSQKQALLEARWQGIKDGIIHMMTRYDPDGPHCEECGKPGNRSTLDLHHLRRRSQGGAYEARNGELVCRPCHEELTGSVQWSEPA